MPQQPAEPNSSGPQSPGDWTQRHLWHIRPVRDVVLIAFVLFLLWFGYYLRSIFTPVLIALFLAYLFNPLITYAERRARMPRPLTIAVLLLVLFLVGAGLIVRLGPSRGLVRAMQHDDPPEHGDGEKRIHERCSR